MPIQTWECSRCCTPTTMVLTNSGSKYCTDCYKKLFKKSKKLGGEINRSGSYIGRSR